MAMASESITQRRSQLRDIEFFCSLSDDALDELAQLTRPKRLRAREELCHKGDPGGDFFAVVSGRLKAVSANEEGKEAIFLLMGPGEVVGEISLLDAGPRSVTLVAATDTELLMIPRRDCLAFLRRQPDLALALAELLAARVRRLSETVEDAYFRNLPVRLAKTLLALARSAGVETDDGTWIDVKLSQQDLADFVGKTREAVNKQLRAWTQDRILSMRDGRLMLHDLDALASLSNPLPEPIEI